MSQVEIKSSDVIKLILQFLKENNLFQSFETLQRQSKISLNIVNTNQFVSSIMKEKWDEVLIILNSLMLNEEHLFNLYELIVDDLIEHDRYQAAEHVIKAFLYKNIRNMTNYRERLLRMEYIIEHPQEKALHKKVVTEHRKQEIIKQCLFDVHEDVEPSRLMKLLTQAIKYQSNEGVIKPGIKLNLFEGKQKIVQQQQETIIKSIQKVVKYQQDAKINSIALSWGEQLLALGGFDGLIEIYNTIDYSYHTGLKFQEEGTALFHDHPVSLMEFNHSDEMLASADTKGLIKIWNLQNGKLLRKIQTETGVNSICWGIDPSHLAVGYQDIKLYGIRSCMVLKEYGVSAGGDFINKIFISDNKIHVATNSGLLKIFNYSTQEELVSTNLRQMVINVLPIYSSRAGNSLYRILVVTSKKIYELNSAGEEQGRYTIEVGQLSNACCVGEYLYEFIKVQDKTNKLNIVSRSTQKNVYYCSLQSQVLLCAQQRQKNLMITYDSQHNLNFWRYSLYSQQKHWGFYICYLQRALQTGEQTFKPKRTVNS